MDKQVHSKHSTSHMPMLTSIFFCAKRSMQPMVGNCNNGLLRKAYTSRPLPRPHYIHKANNNHFYTHPCIRTNREKVGDKNWLGMAVQWEEKANIDYFYTRPCIRTNREKAGDRNWSGVALKWARKYTMTAFTYPTPHPDEPGKGRGCKLRS